MADVKAIYSISTAAPFTIAHELFTDGITVLASYLQLFDSVPSLANDQAHFVGRDEDLLDGAVTVHVRVEAGPVATLLHDLAQEPPGLPGRESQINPSSVRAKSTEAWLSALDMTNGLQCLHLC